MIELENASRWYGEVIGLNDMTCTIGPGITALLGMNGAGKSTMMRLVAGLLRPTTGQVRVLGLTPFANPELYKKLGYCPEIDRLYEQRTGRSFLQLMARMSGIAEADAKQRVSQVLAQVGMADRADRKLAGYSKGMRQRIKLGQAMIADPSVILLDEPLNGLDPIGRREFMDILALLAKQGKTIVVSSHILFEVEQMTRSVILLHRGRLLASGNLGVIREFIDRHPHRVRIESADPRALATRLLALPYTISAQVDEKANVLEVQTREPDRFYTDLAEIALGDGSLVEAFSSPDNNLESIFRYLVVN